MSFFEKSIFKVGNALRSATTAATELFQGSAQDPLVELKDAWKCIRDTVVDAEQNGVTDVSETALPRFYDTLATSLIREEQGDGEGERERQRSAAVSRSSSEAVDQVAVGDPCMEYFLKRNVLQTTVKYGVKDRPSGLLLQATRLVVTLLKELKQPLLHLAPIHKSLQDLLTKLNESLSNPNCSQELQMEATKLIVAICTILKNSNEHLIPIFIVKRDGHDAYLLLDVTLQLYMSQVRDVSTRAVRCLNAIVSLCSDAADRVIVETDLLSSTLLNDILSTYVELPPEMDDASPLALQALSQLTQQPFTQSWLQEVSLHNPSLLEDPSAVSVLKFTQGFQHVDALLARCSPTVSDAISKLIIEQFFQAIIAKKISQSSEVVQDMATRYLTLMFLTSAPRGPLRKVLCQFAFGEPDSEEPHRLRSLIVSRCDDMSEDLANSTLQFLVTVLRSGEERAFRCLVASTLTLDKTADGVIMTARDVLDQLAVVVPFHLQTEQRYDALVPYLDSAIKQDRELRNACGHWQTTNGILGGTGKGKFGDWDDSEAVTFRVGTVDVAQDSLLVVLARRFKRFTKQSTYTKLLLTSLYAALLQYPVSDLRNFLLSQHQASIMSLLTVLGVDIAKSTATSPETEDQLQKARKFMSMNDMDNLESLPNSARLQAIIFLEEFCKELSAIVLVEANSVVLSSHLS
eukprot:m.188784 g.188784  ORF g.188784 m.188784 type:complete len:689 (+) comp14789_c2_seq16:180-2246(+)